MLHYRNKNSSRRIQRENVEMFLKGCEAYGLKSQDLFQVNDLYENKNLYMVCVSKTILLCMSLFVFTP